MHAHELTDSGEEAVVLRPEDVRVTEEFNRVDSSMTGQCRQYVFAEFFAGMGGFSEAMKFMSDGKISVSLPDNTESLLTSFTLWVCITRPHRHIGVGKSAQTLSTLSASALS